jgi:hypothetical protein
MKKLVIREAESVKVTAAAFYGNPLGWPCP